MDGLLNNESNNESGIKSGIKSSSASSAQKQQKKKGKIIPVYNISEEMEDAITNKLGQKIGPFLRLAALEKLRSLGYEIGN